MRWLGVSLGHSLAIESGLSGNTRNMKQATRKHSTQQQYGLLWDYLLGNITLKEYARIMSNRFPRVPYPRGIDGRELRGENNNEE